MNVLLSKLKEVAISVSPMVVLVFILSFTIAPVPPLLLAQFAIGAVLIMFGLTLLLHGVDIGFLPLGSLMGKALLTSNKLSFAGIVSFILGFLITFAEPSVQVLSTQVSSVTDGFISSSLIRVFISLGAGMLLSLGITRIVKNFSMRVTISVVLGVLFLLTLFASLDMLAIAFDSVGSATGAVTVPFILAIALGASAMKRDSKAGEEGSFGLVGITALGAAFGILIINLFIDTGDDGGHITLPDTDGGSLFGSFLSEMPGVALSSLFALLPIIILFFIFQVFKFRMNAKPFRRMLIGFLYAYAGLFLFFIGVNAGFMSVGNIVGQGVAGFGNNALIIGIGSLLGMLIVLTEPAVYVFTHQIEDITNGAIKRRLVLIFLAVGVACSVGLSMLRIIVPGIMLWHYLLPGFAIAAALSFITPKLFVGIGFDSGAVAAGPMTATFVLAFSQGVSDGVEYSILMVDSFGVIAMVTMMPIIALQLLGVVYKIKSKKKGVQQNNVI